MRHPVRRRAASFDRGLSAGFGWSAGIETGSRNETGIAIGISHGWLALDCHRNDRNGGGIHARPGWESAGFDLRVCNPCRRLSHGGVSGMVCGHRHDSCVGTADSLRRICARTCPSSWRDGPKIIATNTAQPTSLSPSALKSLFVCPNRRQPVESLEGWRRLSAAR
jgi:hypothetical protein